MNAAAVEGKGEQTDFPSPLSLSPVTAVGRKRAVLGYPRKETGKGPVAGLNKGGRDLKCGEGTNDNNHLGEELGGRRRENTDLNYAKNKCSPRKSPKQSHLPLCQDRSPSLIWRHYRL